MKKIKISLPIMFMVCLTIMNGCRTPEKDSVGTAQKQNENSAIDEDISEFLTEAADARLMSLEEGKLAKERGYSEEVKKYGEWMIADQTKLMHEIKVLAGSKNITLPASLSNQKVDGLEDLKEEEGADFDEEFIKMMTIDHKRDVKAFEDATDFKDKDVRQFATHYLPVIESHLEKIRDLKKAKGNLSVK